MTALCKPGDIKARKSIAALEGCISQCPQVDVPVEHFFAPGTYARQMTMAAGIMLTGKIHRHSHLNILSQGELLISSEFGQQHVKAPATWVSEPGIKRALLSLSDVVFTTIHATESTDLEEIEAEMIAENYEQLPGMVPALEVVQ